MSTQQTQKQFERQHISACKNLAIEKEYLLRRTSSGLLQRVHADLAMTLDVIHRNLSPDKPVSPGRTFRAALRGLDELDAKRFLLHNVLEALKRGESEARIAQNYAQLGLIEPVATPTDVPAGAAAKRAPAVEAAGAATGSEAVASMQSLKRAGLALCQIAVNALKSIPKFIEIEPGIMLVGFVPVPTFSLKGKGVTAYELFELLRRPGRFSGDTASRADAGPMNASG